MNRDMDRRYLDPCCAIRINSTSQAPTAATTPLQGVTTVLHSESAMSEREGRLTKGKVAQRLSWADLPSTIME